MPEDFSDLGVPAQQQVEDFSDLGVVVASPVKPKRTREEVVASIPPSPDAEMPAWLKILASDPVQDIAYGATPQGLAQSVGIAGTIGLNALNQATINAPVAAYKKLKGLPLEERVFGVDEMQSTLPWRNVSPQTPLVNFNLPLADRDPVSGAIQNVGQSLLTAENLALAPLGGGGTLVEKLIQGLYMGNMANSLPQQAAPIFDSELENKERVQAGLETLVGGGFTGLLGKGLLHRKPVAPIDLTREQVITQPKAADIPGYLPDVPYDRLLENQGAKTTAESVNPQPRPQDIDIKSERPVNPVDYKLGREQGPVIAPPESAQALVKRGYAAPIAREDFIRPSQEPAQIIGEQASKASTITLYDAQGKPVQLEVKGEIPHQPLELPAASGPRKDVPELERGQLESHGSFPQGGQRATDAFREPVESPVKGVYAAPTGGMNIKAAMERGSARRGNTGAVFPTGEEGKPVEFNRQDPEAVARLTPSEYSEKMRGFTLDAQKAGERAKGNPSAIARLEELSKQARADMMQARAEGRVDDMIALSTKPQYFNEALEVARGQADVGGTKAEKTSGGIGGDINKAIEKNKESGSIPNLFKPIIDKFKSREKEKRGDFATDAPRVLLNPKESGFQSPTKEVDAVQLVNRLKNKVSAAEMEGYEKGGTLDAIRKLGKVSPEKAAEMLQEGGQEVQTSVYGMEGKVSEAKKEYDRMTHEWYDSLDTPTKSAVRQYNADIGDIPKDVAAKRLTDKQRELADKYKTLEATVSNEPRDTSPRATSAYSKVSTFDTTQPMPEWTKSKSGRNVQRVDVVIPLDRIKSNIPGDIIGSVEDRHNVKWTPDNLHENLPNTLGWAMIQYKTGAKAEKIAVIAEAQSRWGQERRALDKYLKRDKSVEWEGDIPNLKTPKHELLNDYNRLILKAAIEQARKEGATHIMVSDGETAMMTEGHDANMSETRAFGATAAEAIRQTREDGWEGGVNPTARKIGHNEWILTSKIHQEPGMRLNYDSILPKIAEELTGSKGERVSLGGHKNAFEYGIESGNRRVLGGEGARNKQRSNLIFRNPDNTPKIDVSGLMFPLDKVPDKAASLYEKDRPEARGAKVYSGAFFLDPDFYKGTGKDLTKFGSDVVSYYSEPIIERLARLGGPVSKVVSQEAGQIVSKGKEYYGGLTSTVDPAKLAAGKLNAANTWIRGTDKVTDRAATSRLISSVEGTGIVPPHVADLVTKLKAANLAIGQLAQRANLSFVPSGKVQRMLTSYGVDIVRRGSGPAWDEWTKGLAQANGKPLSEVQDFLRKWKKELDEPSSDVANLDKINQDFVRKWPKAISHIRPGTAWHEVLVSDPFNYIEQAAQRTAHAVAFREVYPADSGLLQATRKEVMKELQTDVAGAEFDNLIRALQGHPTDSFTSWWSAPDSVLGGTMRMAGQTVGQSVKALMLTGNAITNLGEVIAGGPTIFLGLRNVFPAMIKLGQIYPQLEMQGAVNRAMVNMAFDVNSPVRSLAKIFAGGVRKAFLEQTLNELQETQAAAAAKVVSSRVLNGTLSEWEKQHFVAVMRAMGFDKPQAQDAVLGRNTELLTQFENRAASWLTAGNQQMAEKSRLGSSRLFNELFWFQSYPQMAWNQARSVVVNLYKDINSKDFKQATQNAKLLGRLFGGRTLQGALTIGISALAYELIFGLQERKQEARDEAGKFILDSFLGSMGGMATVLKKTLEASGDSRALNQTIGTTITPLGVIGEVLDASIGNGKYEGMTTTERIGKVLESKTPGYKAIKSGLALAGLMEEDKELTTAKNAFYRWRRNNMGWRQEINTMPEIEDANFRNKIAKAVKALENGQDWKKELAESGDLERASKSLYSRTMLKGVNGKPLTEEELTKLRNHIGSRLVDRLQTRDAMVRELARGLSEKKELEEVVKPTGQFAMDMETGTKRASRVESGMSEKIKSLLKETKVNLTFSPQLKIANTNKALSVPEGKLMEQDFNEAVSLMLGEVVDNPEFKSMPTKQKKVVVEKYVKSARDIAKAKATERAVK